MYLIKLQVLFATLVCKQFARSPNVSNLVGVFAPAFFPAPRSK
jgi:hypothetical protein